MGLLEQLGLAEDYAAVLAMLERRIDALERANGRAASDVVASQSPGAGAFGGASWKTPVRVATAAALPAFGGSGTGTLEGTAAAALTIDGIAVAVGNRVLVKNQVVGTAKDNGIYEVVQAGSGAEKWKITRTSDALTGTQFEESQVWVHEGTINAHIPFRCSTAGTIIVNTTALTWLESGDVTLGTAQTISGTKTFTGTMILPVAVIGAGTEAAPTTEIGLVGNVVLKAVRTFLLEVKKQMLRSIFLVNAIEAAEVETLTVTSLAPILEIKSTVPTVISSLEPATGGGKNGEELTLINVGTNNITLENESAKGTVGRKFLLPGKENIVLGPNHTVTLLKTGEGWVALGKV